MLPAALIVPPVTLPLVKVNVPLTVGLAEFKFKPLALLIVRLLRAVAPVG